MALEGGQALWVRLGVDSLVKGTEVNSCPQIILSPAGAEAGKEDESPANLGR